MKTVFWQTDIVQALVSHSGVVGCFFFFNGIGGGMSWYDLKHTTKQEVSANIKACLLSRQALPQIFVGQFLGIFGKVEKYKKIVHSQVFLIKLKPA